MDDASQWNETEWTTITSNAACEPKINVSTQTVTYEALQLPDCAFKSNQKEEEIEYILKISAEKGASATGQLRGYDHLYYITCNYDNTGRTFASFVPIKNRAANDTGMQLWLR